MKHLSFSHGFVVACTCCLFWSSGFPAASGQSLVQRFDGSGAYDRAGDAVSGGFDLDFDGVPDVAIGIPHSNLASTDSGTVEVRSGRSATLLLQLSNPQVAAHFGSAVALVGDLDGDGRSELLVGAPEYDVSGSDCGRAYLYSGRTGGLLANFSGY